MIELGKRADVLGVDQLKPLSRRDQLQLVGKRPDRMPDTQGGRLVCGYNQGLGERLIVIRCDSTGET